MTLEWLSSKRIQGVTADTKPTLVPIGTEFMNTQTKVFSIFDGTVWNDVAGGTGGGGGGSGTVKGGTYTTNGTASQKIFTIPHGLGTAPTGGYAFASSIDALGEYQTDIDSTNITITYQIAPASGTGNLVWIWGAHTDITGGGGGSGTGMVANGGTISFSGDSSNKTFSIPHGLGEIPAGFSVEPSSVDALGDFQVDKDITNLVVTYQVAPPTATNNVVFEWMATATADVLSTTNTKTVTGKTVDTVTNILQNSSSNYLMDVFKSSSDSLWKARNTKTGVIISSNADATTVIQAAINGLTASRTWQEGVKIHSPGTNISIDIWQILIPSYTILDYSECLLKTVRPAGMADDGPSNPNAYDGVSILTNTASWDTADMSGVTAVKDITIICGKADGNRFNLGNDQPSAQNKNFIYFVNADNVVLINPWIIRAQHDGIRLKNCTNCIIYHPYIEDNRSEGISFRDGNNNLILDGEYLETGWSFFTALNCPKSMFIGGRGYRNGSSSSSANISSKQCIVDGFYATNIAGGGISLGDDDGSHSTIYAADETIVQNCTLDTIGTTAVTILSFRTRGIKILNNTIKNVTERAIALGGPSDRFVFSGNIISNCGHTGIYLNGTTGLDGNSIVKLIQRGVITNNIIKNCGMTTGAADHLRSGIAIYGSQADAVTDIICTNNHCFDDQGTKTQKYGILLNNTLDCDVYQNNLNGNLTDGMTLTGTNNNLVRYNNRGYSSNLTIPFVNQANTWSGIQTLTTPVINGATLSGTFTLPTGTTPITLSKPNTGTEVFLDMTIDDASGSRIRFANNTSGVGIFAPVVSFRQLSSNVGLPAGTFLGEILDTSDTGTTAVFRIDGRIGSPSGAALTARPMFDIHNFGTQEYVFGNAQADWKNNTSTGMSEMAGSSLTNKRWGHYQPAAGTTAATVGNVQGLLVNHITTGAGSNTNTFDTTEGVVINLLTSTTINENAGLVSPTGGVGVGRRLFGAKAKIRSKVDTVTGSVSRYYFGFTSATVLPISNSPLATSDHGIIVGFNSTDTTYKIYHNDGATSVTIDDVTGTPAISTGYHTIEINWTASGNIIVTFDGVAQTISTDLPATTANLFFNAVVQNATAAARTHTIKGIWVETDK